MRSPGGKDAVAGDISALGIAQTAYPYAKPPAKW
jgi:hypothetical protein